MTKTAHTPGPWIVTRQYVVGPRDESDSQGFGMVVGVADVYGDNRNQDARLIAAAPDMLEALKLVADSGKFSCFDDLAWDAVNAAIAKAEGRT